jgi:hypothetical protein
VEFKTDEWCTELKRLNKTRLIADHPRQRELRQFILDCLNHLKHYFPMMRTLRTRGLAVRHWNQVAAKLSELWGLAPEHKIKLDPATITLHQLIMYDLHDPENLKLIKQVCEVATKEYAV